MVYLTPEFENYLKNIQKFTESINKNFARVHPFTIESPENRRLIQSMVDEVREVSMYVRLALRNYEKVFEQNTEFQKIISDLEDKLKELHSVEDSNS